MGSNYIMLKFSVSKPIYFELGDWCEVPGFGKFELVELYKPNYNKISGGYDYELVLEAYYCKWRNKIFKYTPEMGGQEASWSLTATLDVHLGIFVRNLKALGYKYNNEEFTFSVDSTVAQSAKLLTYNNCDMISALNMMAQEWECEWWITDHIIYFGRCEFGTPIDFIQGVNVDNISSSENKNIYATRVYAFGSTRNIPANYRTVDESIVVNGIVQKRLMLPIGTPYVDAFPDMPIEAAIEQVVVFDDVFPRTNGLISLVHPYSDTITNDDGTTATETFYRFKDNGIKFSKDYILNNEELHIIFQSGSLNGLDFGVIFNPLGVAEKLADGTWNPDAQLWEIVASEDYGRKLPDTVLKPKSGDKYVLYGWDATKIADLGLIDAAEKELLQKTEEYVAKIKVDPNSYPCTMMSDWIKEQGQTPQGFFMPFSLGDRVKLYSDAFFENGSRLSRIIGYECQLDYPYDSPIITIGESPSTSRISALEETVEAITLKGQTFTGNGNGSGIYLISTNDTTPPTNRNTLSALRSLKEFLSKVSDDVAAGRITFAQGLRAVLASTMEGGVQFGKEFADGVKGLGGKIDEHGDAWLGGLRLRDFLEVPELRYNRTEITVGNAWRAPGGGIIESVTPERNADGTLTDKGTITLHLEDGEIGAVAVGDLCQGIFHDAVNTDNNAAADSDDGRGNFHFAGFCTVYFKVTEIVESGRNSVFRYQLREVSERWTWQHHPSAQMHFVGYGNNAKKEDGTWKYPERQTSRYSTRTYERYLHNVNSWEIGSGNIGAQFGDMTNLSIFGINMQGYSEYLDNVYMRGRIEQLDLTPRMELEYGGDGFMAYGETRAVKCRMLRGWNEVDGSIEWAVTRDTGNASADAAWSAKAKAADFAGEIAIHYGGQDDDLGMTPDTGATFTFTATAGGQTASAKLTLRRNPQDGTDGTAGRNYTHNLLLGSEFPVTRRWAVRPGVSIDDTHTLEGRNSIKSSQSGLTGNNHYRGIQQYYDGTVKAGDVFTASAWCYCEDLSGVDMGAALEIQMYAGNDRVTTTGWASMKPSKAGEWQQGKTTVTVPEGVTRINVTFYVAQNGTVWFSSPKLERGANATPVWTANPADRIATPTELYYLSASDTELAGGSWGTAKPVQTPGHYLWTRTERLYGDGTVELTEPVCVTGEKGEAGTSVTVTSTLVAYQAGTSGTVPPTGLWSLSIPKVPEGQYLWTRTTVAYSDGNSTETYTVSRQGADGTGVTVTSTEVRYAVGNYPAQPADNLFTLTSPGTLTKGQWLWTRTTVTYSDGTPSKSYTAAYIGADGTNGLPGAAGTDGQTSYVHFAYASGITGSLPHPTSVTGFSTTTFVGAKYIGICTDFNAADPTTNVGTTYEWGEYRGADGKDGNSYTGNLLRNSDFANGADFWQVYGGTVDTAEKNEGRNSACFSYSDLPESRYYGWGYYMDYEVAGTDFTFSVDVLVKNLATLSDIPTPVSIEIRCLDANGDRLKTYGAVAVPATAGEWQRFRVSGKTLAGTKQVSVHFMLKQNGTVWFNSPKLEFGDNPAPVWTPYAKGNAGAGFTPNMLPGTRDWDGWTPNGSWASGGSFEGLDVMHGDAAGITTSHLDIAKTGFLDLEADTVYTLSMWAKGSGSFQSFVYPDVNAKTLYIDGAASESKSSDTFAQHTLATEWKRYYVVFRTRAGNALIGKSVVPVRIFKGDNEVWIAGVKLEKGENHATQWTPAQDEMVGKDAYSVMLTNESHVFEGDTQKAVQASTECRVIAYKGNTVVPATIGTVTGMPSGMSVATVNNGSTSAKISIGVNPMLTTKQGTLKIPVTVDGHVFEKTFSWTLALKGAQGIQGCIYRVTQWAAGFDYHNDSAQTGSGIRYVDVVLVPNPALATRAYAYRCKKGHTSSAENAPGVGADTSGNNDWWQKLNSMAPIYTPFLLADEAVISLLQSNRILVMKEEDASIVNVGFGGGKYPLWVGATEATQAPFYVDDTGKAYMTGAEISGKVTAGDPDGQRVALLPEDKTMKIYDESGHEVSSYEGNTYSDPLSLFGLTSGAIAMKQRTGTHYGYGSGVTYGRGSHTLTGNGLGTNTEYENLIISGSIHSDAPVEVIVSGYLYTEYKEQATIPSYPGGIVTPVASGDTPVTDLTPIDPGGTVPLYNSTARLTLYIDTYSDALLTTRVGSQEIARCGKKGDGVLISQKRVKTTTGGYHVLRLAISMTTTGDGVTATVKWGSAVSGKSDISGTYTSDFYMSRYFANGFCLGISMNNYISTYDQGDKKGMRFVMENNGYGIDVSNAGIRHKHHGGNWVSIPLFVMKARYGYTNGSYIRYDSKSFNGSYPSLSHKGQGWVRLTYPPAWSTLGTLSAANLIVNVTGYGASAEDGKSPLKATVTVITSEYIDITLSDDESPNNGGFLIDISLLE